MAFFNGFAPGKMDIPEQQATKLWKDDDHSHHPGPSYAERVEATDELARQLQRRFTAESIHTEHLFNPDPDSDLNPANESFDTCKFIRELGNLGSKAQGAEGRTMGLAFRNMSVHGFGSDADYQKTVGNVPLFVAQSAMDMALGRKRKVQILDRFDGLIKSGEMLVVLGPPGSGCSTMLKTIAGEMNGIYMDEESDLNYMGITEKQMRTRFRGEAIYTAEVDHHFPKLTVGDTLSIAAAARAPAHLPKGISQGDYADIMADVVTTMYGIAHTKNTVVGNDYVRGVSGGERKRVTIAEASLSGAPLQCWDNSTRGLDSANAIDFCRNLRMSADYLRITSVVAIYQAPQAAYDVFDKVSVLYEGQQIYFGRTTDAKDFFVRMGFACPEQQTTPDFLTSLSSPLERKPAAGFEGRVPSSAQEFATAWRASPEYAQLQAEIEGYNQSYPLGGERYEQFKMYRRSAQSKHMRHTSPYTLSYMGQVRLTFKRSWMRFKAEPALAITQIVFNIILALIVGSLYYNLQPTSASLTRRGSLIFFATLLNAFGSALEIVTLYNQRPITEKHGRYAYYHPSADALGSIILDLPFKIVNVTCMNLILYFITNLRREPGPFFFFLFVSFLIFQTMSFFFRMIASSSRTLAQALAPSAPLLLALVIYTGYAVPIDYMRGWARWINYIDPVAYGFEALLLNELAGREFACSSLVPSGGPYDAIGLTNRVCSAVGSTAGSDVVSGTAFLELSYSYMPAHKWRNVGILFAFLFAFLAAHLLTTEFITAKKSKGEVLLFRRGQIPQSFLDRQRQHDAESGTPSSSRRSSDNKGEAIIQRQTAIFSWKDVVYDIKIKNEPRRILDHVDGWVKPGTLTALMGVSGAGKTTLLDVLATRVTMGIITGEMLVDGRHRDSSFQRKTGYVQQQDVHLSTSTVREALRFSATLRQPRHVSMAEKHQYVEEIITLLEMDAYGDAVVGSPGEGLNVEQRKRLTIGVELVAKPELLLFLDEPTSGLDSQTSWNILQLLRKLTAHGQAVLCTIHQPSAILFENFDKLLFLAKGGRTVYFGDVGKGSQILIDYFTRNGATPYHKGENPAEWIFTAIGAARGSHSDIDWHETWLASPERQGVRNELERLKRSGETTAEQKSDAAAYAEFAAPPFLQFRMVLTRVFQQYWRTPSYLWSKAFLCISAALFIGFSYFKGEISQQGIQNQLLGVFMIFTIFSHLVQQIMPNFVVQRELYEARERPSKTYSWPVFILSSILVEIPWALLMGALIFFCWYYPLGAYQNAVPTDAVALRGAQVFLFVEVFLLFNSTFSLALVAGMSDAATAANVANLLFSLCLTFCGVLITGPSMPGFWKFMWRVSPVTYLVEGMITAAVANTRVICSEQEYLKLTPPGGQTCLEYLEPYMRVAGGYLEDENAATNCSFCQIATSNDFLALFGLDYSHAWRDFGIIWAYVVVNIFGAIGLYWIFRVPKKPRKEKPDPEDMTQKRSETQSEK